jgi:Domain of unknown function (DUF4136)
MRLTKQLSLAAAFLFVAAWVYAQDVHYNYTRGTNFAAFRTYQWVDIPADAVGDQLIDRSIKQAVDEQLAQKGLTRVEEDADLFIGYHAGVNLEKGVNLSGTGGPQPMGPWDSWGSVHGETSTIPVGVLVVDVYDPAKKQLIWRGDASKTIDLKKDPEKNYRELEKAMAKLFKNYPPQAHK